MQNQMLQKARANIDAKVKPQDKNAYDRIVLAGMKIMFDKSMNQTLLQGLQNAPDKIAMAAEGIVGILGLLYKESRNTMPVTPMIMAGMSLLIEALAFMEEAGIVQVDPAALDKATQHYMDTLLPKLGINQQTMTNVLNKTQQTVQDPQKMAMIQQNMGG